MDANTLRGLQAQAAVDRKVAVGLGEGFANPFSFSAPVTLPTGYTLYVVAADRDSGTGFAGGGNGSAAVFYRVQADRSWRDITASLPADATADVRAMAHEGTTWWAGGVKAAGGGWLAVSTDDGVTWASVTVVAGITGAVYALADVVGLILYVGGANGELHQWVAPATWTDLGTPLGFGTDDVLDIAIDGVAGVMVVGGDSTPTFTCKYSANAGATWADRTAALAAAAPVRVVTRMYANAFAVAGNDCLRATYDTGAHWEEWAINPDVALLYPIYDLDFMWSDEALIATAVGLYSVAFRGSEILPMAKLGVTVRSIKFTPLRIYLATDILGVSTAGGSVVTVNLGVSRSLMRPGYATRVQGAGTHVLRYGLGLLAGVLVSSSAAGAEDVTFYDNTAASGTVVALLHLPATPAPFEWRPLYPVRLAVGLTVVLASNNQDVTVVLE